MYVQFSEKLPGVVIDENNKSIYVDTTGVAETIEELYGKYVEGDLDFFAISKNFAEGFYEFLEYLKSAPADIKFIKGQTTGPISYALSVTDQNRKAIIHDRDLFEVLTKTLSMRVRWQVKKLKKYNPNVIIFIDEPYLVSIGSSFVNINIENAFERLGEVIKAVKAEGAIAAVHCCGNTDFGLLLKSDIDILNFDAYNFAKEFSLYAQDVGNFLARGGTIAWGIVPSSDAIRKETKYTLVEKMDAALKLLIDKKISKETISSIVTPSCGTGTLDEAETKKILEAVNALSVELIKKEKK
jgi:methionine synthase II (cobalamin-independent)